MKRAVIVLVVVGGLLAALPVSAQSPQLTSQFNGNTVTNNFMPSSAPNQNQLTATSIVSSWIGQVGKGITNLFTGPNVVTNLFTSSGSTTALAQPMYQVTGPFATPVASQMKTADFMGTFGIYYLQPNP